MNGSYLCFIRFICGDNSPVRRTSLHRFTRLTNAFQKVGKPRVRPWRSTRCTLTSAASTRRFGSRPRWNPDEQALGSSRNRGTHRLQFRRAPPHAQLRLTAVSLLLLAVAVALYVKSFSHFPTYFRTRVTSSQFRGRSPSLSNWHRVRQFHRRSSVLPLLPPCWSQR